ncbi:hypothetical protein [Methanobrevibacter curvatus]|uniref:hypothetical protein n=1 Tax=Methanobrevibacter curvatus TaxID=49547 RepID=UPI0012ED0BF5|nr:hypothetical protein [Methanobrevibacter curvatus]
MCSVYFLILCYGTIRIKSTSFFLRFSFNGIFIAFFLTITGDVDKINSKMIKFPRHSFKTIESSKFHLNSAEPYSNQDHEDDI